MYSSAQGACQEVTGALKPGAKSPCPALKDMPLEGCTPWRGERLWRTRGGGLIMTKKQT